MYAGLDPYPDAKGFADEDEGERAHRARLAALYAAPVRYTVVAPDGTARCSGECADGRVTGQALLAELGAKLGAKLGANLEPVGEAEAAAVRFEDCASRAEEADRAPPPPPLGAAGDALAQLVWWCGGGIPPKPAGPASGAVTAGPASDPLIARMNEVRSLWDGALPAGSVEQLEEVGLSPTQAWQRRFTLQVASTRPTPPAFQRGSDEFGAKAMSDREIVAAIRVRIGAVTRAQIPEDTKTSKTSFVFKISA